MYDEYGEVVVEGDGGYYYSPQGPTAEAERMRPRAMVPGRGVMPRPRAPLAISAVGEGRARRDGPSQGKRKLKAVMQLSRIAVSAHRPGTAEAAPSPWKKAKIFPMMLQKVKGKDADYDKLMAARQLDGEDSMVIKGSYFLKTAGDRPSAKKLDRALKRISVSKKIQKPPTSEEVSESDSKSGISISVTTESEAVTEESDYVKKKRRRRPSSSSVASSASSASASQSDKDYLKVTLDETTESTVDSDEENGDSESSGSTSSSSSEEESSDSQSKASETEEDDSESKVSSSAISSTSTDVTAKSGTNKSSGSKIKDQSSTAGSEVDDTVEELSEEEPPPAVEEELGENEASSTNEKTASSTQKDSSEGEADLSDHGTEGITESAASESETPSDLTSF
ncbi:hypothetical protein lerEdw1_001973 [Lerista edwardsae]|nr:hypothetical protein lerEdw1_001973 [Lerista edwardsae]